MTPRRLSSVVATVAFLALAWALREGPGAHAQAGASPAFDQATIARGRELALIGNCLSCHTTAGKPPLSGGRALKIAFGTLYSSNITPDAATGIGDWSLEDFTRAMREGVDRNGRNLYPAFPYDHFTHVADDDIRAIYAYLMTRDPVRAKPPHNRLAFPANLRPLISVWKGLYLKQEPVPNNPAQSAAWNRGAYLVEGLAHCGACHTPRNVLQAEKQDQRFDGGTAEDWRAPALNENARARKPWTEERLVAYLRRGMDDVHDVSAGPMNSVVHNLAQVSESEVRAIAVYVASLGRTDAQPGQAQMQSGLAPGSEPPQAGAAIYAEACASCHDQGRRAQPESGLALEQSTAVADDTPANLIHIVREGIVPEDGTRGPWMPGFAGALTDDQMAALTNYLRARYTDRPPWPDVEGEIRKVVQAEVHE